MFLDRMTGGRRWLATLFMGVAGLMGGALLALLVGNVGARAIGGNPVWVSETARVLFVWGTALGMISVSLSGQHFRVDLMNKGPAEDEAGAGSWELVLQLSICAVLAYIAWFAFPTIQRAASQPMASIPLTYGALRSALVMALVGMLAAHLWRALEVIIFLSTRRPIPDQSSGRTG